MKFDGKIPLSISEIPICEVLQDKEKFTTGGLGWFVAGLFIVAQLAGGGIVALPTAMVQAGLWTGLLFNVILTLMAATTSIMLGNSWVLLRRRWPMYKRHCREPYPEMCDRALGSKFRKLASVCIQLNQFEICVVFLLLSSKNISDFLKAFFGVQIGFCLLIIILALFLFPFTLFKSPEDFWWAAVLSVFTTSLAVLLICVGSVLDYPTCSPHHNIPREFRITNHFLALGTILFAYGGHPGFPTIQNDMKKPEDFKKSTILAFTFLVILYTPVYVLGYLTYGSSLRESIMNSIQHVWIQHLASFLITGHAIFTIIIVINPINQIAEKYYNIPQDFCYQRILVRGAVFLLVVFVAESVPTFGPLLDLSGGSTQTATALVFPCLVYLFLNAGEKKAALQRELIGQKKKGTTDRATITDVLGMTERKTLFVSAFIIAFGLIGGSAATFSAIRELTSTHFVLPCYLSFLFSGNGDHPPSTSTNTGLINCCGQFQNITAHREMLSNQICTTPNLHFYD